MTNNQSNTEQNTAFVKAGLDKLKTEVASELGVDFTSGYHGELSSRDCGMVGGEMVRRMIARAEADMK